MCVDAILTETGGGGGGGVEPPPGQVCGAVEGCPAVFHVAVVGHLVVATEGDVLSYGSGPGTNRQKNPSI